MDNGIRIRKPADDPSDLGLLYDGLAETLRTQRTPEPVEYNARVVDAINKLGSEADPMTAERLEQARREIVTAQDVASVPLAPVDPFPVQRIDPHVIDVRALPDYALGVPPGKIVISYLDRGYLYVVQAVEYSRWTIALLRIIGALGLFYASLNPKERHMVKALKIAGKLAKIVGGAVGLGGFLSGFLSPELSATIYAGSMVVGNIIQFGGDLADDGKINNSFSVEE